MSRQQHDIHNEAPVSKYFTQIVNMADDDLNPYQYRLLGHYIRVCGSGEGGACTQGVRKIAETCQMSVGMVSRVRKQLEELGWIRCEARPNNTVKVTLIDRMAENVARYSKRSQPEQSDGERSYSEHGVHGMNSTVHTMNERITRTPVETLNGAIAPLEPSPNGAHSKPKSKRPRKPPTPRGELPERDILYETVELRVYGIEGGYDQPYDWNGRPGIVTKWLRGEVAKWKNHAFGKISAPAQPQHVEQFLKWYTRKHPGQEPPKGIPTFVEYWRKFGSEMRSKPATASGDWETFA